MTTSQPAPGGYKCCRHCETTARFVPAMTCQTPDAHDTACDECHQLAQVTR